MYKLDNVCAKFLKNQWYCPSSLRNNHISWIYHDILMQRIELTLVGFVFNLSSLTICLEIFTIGHHELTIGVNANFMSQCSFITPKAVLTSLDRLTNHPRQVGIGRYSLRKCLLHNFRKITHESHWPYGISATSWPFPPWWELSSYCAPINWCKKENISAWLLPKFICKW